ncbi:MAG TPA: hypothetical protein VKS01_07665 [Bryobacteraceae bacterium]|nr:hypothetical protein [Bryobacteraceae bacterium]
MYTRFAFITVVITVFAGSLSAGPTNFAGVQAFVTASPTFDTIYSTSAAFGPANSAVSGSWICDSSCVGFTTSGAGQAGFGVLGASVDLNVPSVPAPNFFAISETESHFIDDLTMTGGTGSGVLELDYTVHGTTNSALASAGLALCTTNGCTDPNVFYSLNGGALTSQGTLQPGFRSNATLKFYVPFTYGVALEIEPFLNTQAQFEAFRGTPFDASANFNSTAIITGAFVLGGTSSAPGSSVKGAGIGDDDGFSFGPGGLTAGAPEPGTWLLASTALAGLLLAKRRAARDRC